MVEGQSRVMIIFYKCFGLKVFCVPSRLFGKLLLVQVICMPQNFCLHFEHFMFWCFSLTYIYFTINWTFKKHCNLHWYLINLKQKTYLYQLDSRKEWTIYSANVSFIKQKISTNQCKLSPLGHMLCWLHPFQQKIAQKVSIRVR